MIRSYREINYTFGKIRTVVLTVRCVITHTVSIAQLSRGPIKPYTAVNTKNNTGAKYAICNGIGKINATRLTEQK